MSDCSGDDCDHSSHRQKKGPLTVGGRRTPMLLAAMAALAHSAGGTGIVPSEYDGHRVETQTEADLERIRKAQEKRARRAERNRRLGSS